jgi:Putative prokaryotic signal transducing protein
MEFIQVRAFDNYISAHIRMGMLQEAGINCHLKDEYTGTVGPFLSTAPGGMKLMVESTQVQRALDLLKETD